MPQEFSINIEEVVGFLDLQRDPKSRPGASSFNVRCPFCGDTKYHMNIDTRKNAYRCAKCSGDAKHLGVLDLYGRVRFGTPVVPGVNSKEMFKSLLKDLNREGYQGTYQRSEKKEIVLNAPATDVMLHAAYSALLDLPYLALTDAHRDNLLKRGLDERDIAANGYRSMQNPRIWVENHPDYGKATAVYDKLDLEKEKKRYSKTERLSRPVLIAGLLIANDLLRREVALDGVPGFFQLSGKWLYLYSVGMMIPTRNCRRQIVGLQMRTDTGNASRRYITVSSKGLERGVDYNISRTHFPLANRKLAEGAYVYLTEGPLKADVIAKLSEEPVIVIAIQGVDNIRELPEIFQMLKKQGVTRIFNAFDMDKMTNPNVSRASKRIRELLAAEGIQYPMLVWDYGYGLQKQAMLKTLCRSRTVDWKEKHSLSLNLASNSAALAESDRSVLDLVPDGYAEPVKEWRKCTKGLDDFLLCKKQMLFLH